MRKSLKSNVYYIKQTGISRFLNFFKKSSESIVSTDLDTWYDEETEFDNVYCWSKPNAKINLIGITRLDLTISCPIGRQINFKASGINKSFVLSPSKKTVFSIDVKGLSELFINTEPYNPEMDERQLGICLWNIEYKF